MKGVKGRGSRVGKFCNLFSTVSGKLHTVKILGEGAGRCDFEYMTGKEKGKKDVYSYKPGGEVRKVFGTVREALKW